MKIQVTKYLSSTIVLMLCMTMTPSHASILHVGANSISITPDQPVAVSGQMQTRIAREVQTAVQANALALESREGDTILDQAIFVACGLVYIPEEVYTRDRADLKKCIPDFVGSKLIISATHTHTAPVLLEGKYKIYGDDVMRPAAYTKFLSTRIADAAEAAWKNRQPAQAGWGMGDAMVGYNRRSVFEDGHGQMYGDISIDSFRGIEGPEDHAVEVLFFWGMDDSLIATSINIVSPAQEVESLSAVNADFWHPVREGLKEKYGKDLVVLGWIGAAGDQSPRTRYRRAAEDRMRELRGLSRLDEIARRIIRAYDEAYEGVEKEKFADLPLVHQVKNIELPRRMVTDEEYKEVQEKIAAAPKDDKNHRAIVWHSAVLDRYERQQSGEVITPYSMELHTLRLGDIAITTNDFELYTQYGIQMKAKSKALHTFVIQLAGPGSYVPTPIAAKGKGYSAIVESNEVGAEGGQVLVDETVAAVNQLFPDEK